ncbi:MAG: inverse autotransporter beta domain-containing protein, partial [Gammaproteobacteria bacterium]
MFGMFAGMFDICHLSSYGARRTAETFGKTAFAVIALIGGFYTLTFADKTSAQQLPQPSISHTAQSGGFADFRKQQQARLLAHIDDTLAAGAEKAIGENFAAIKQVGVNLQTGLGGRKANIGINFIGSFAESEKDAFGWQLRGYAAKEDAAGLNAGVFYRQTSGGILYGANVFADYEKHDYGNFLRYSIGGELQHSIFALAANYYVPITDNRRVNATVAAFSREGYDAKLRIAAPHYKALKAAVDYYRFDGEGDTKADSGFRYGVEVHPHSALRFGVYYDSGGEKFGGDIAYSFGEEQKRESNAAFAPDMFAAVSREYSQRIATVATVPVSVRITPLLTITNAMTAAAITTTTRITAAAITTRTRITAAAITTTMTTFPVILSATRMASVHFTVRQSLTWITTPFTVVATSTVKYLFTLPPASQITRPLVIITMTNLERGIAHEAIMISVQNVPAAGSHIFAVGNGFDFGHNLGPHTLTITEGSEEFISVSTTLTTRTTTTIAAVITETPMTMAAVSTTTTMTMAAVSTTTRITTFSTMFITLTANTAMGDMGDSRFRGNDEGGGNPLYVIALKGR